MRSGPSTFLVDTNVLVYAYDSRDQTKRDRAVLVLEELGRSRLGALSVQVLGEFFWTTTRKLPAPLTAAEAERNLIDFARSWTIFDLNASIVLEAVRAAQRHSLAYWDGLIWATAKMNGVPNILSEDFAHGMLLEGVRILNPFSERFDLSLLQPRA